MFMIMIAGESVAAVVIPTSNEGFQVAWAVVPNWWNLLAALCNVYLLQSAFLCRTEFYLQSETEESSPARNTVAEAEEPLPPGWATAVAPNGRMFYIDHNTKATTWVW